MSPKENPDPTSSRRLFSSVPLIFSLSLSLCFRLLEVGGMHVVLCVQDVRFRRPACCHGRVFVRTLMRARPRSRLFFLGRRWWERNLLEGSSDLGASVLVSFGGGGVVERERGVSLLKSLENWCLWCGGMHVEGLAQTGKKCEMHRLKP